MKKYRFAFVLFSCLLGACSTTTYSVNDVDSITPNVVDLYRVQLAVKDFKVIQPVFAQTSVTLNDELSDMTDSTSIKNLKYDAKSGDGEKLHKTAMSGSFIIHRRLLDEAFKLGADDAINIHIEYEQHCRQQSVVESTETHFNAKAFLNVVSALTSVAGAVTTASGGNATAQHTLSTTAQQTANVAKQAPSDISSTSKSESSKMVCTLTLYGNALAIKYTDAIVPTLSVAR